MTVASLAVGRTPRVVGVDVARGVALVGMMATHTFGTLDDNDHPTLAHMVAGGRAATTFVLVAGVSLAFLSGGRTAVGGHERIGVSAGLAVRAVLIGAIGLALGYLAPFNGTLGILTFYGLFFLLAIPLLGSPPLVLIGIAIATVALGPVLIVATAGASLPYAGTEADPTFTTLIHDPIAELTLTHASAHIPSGRPARPCHRRPDLCPTFRTEHVWEKCGEHDPEIGERDPEILDGLPVG